MLLVGMVKDTMSLRESFHRKAICGDLQNNLWKSIETEVILFLIEPRVLCTTKHLKTLQEKQSGHSGQTLETIRREQKIPTRRKNLRDCFKEL